MFPRFNGMVASLMRHIVYVFVALLLWGLADDFLVNGPQASPRALASDDDEYLLTGAKRTPQRMVEQEKSPLCAGVAPTHGCSPLAELSLSFSEPGLRSFCGDSCLYVFMSLQI
jgi:hypothetical protein